MNGPDAEPLLPGLAAGDERAFAALYDRYAVRLYRTAYRLLGRREDAEDAVQDVFMATARSCDKLGSVEDLTAYLFAALRRSAARCAKRRTKLPQVSSAMVDGAFAPIEQQPYDKLDLELLQKAIQTLPDEQREVMTLRIDGELTFAQIAEVMDVSLSTVASRYQYALKKLRNALVAKRPSPDILTFS